TRATMKVSAVVPLPETQTASGADWIDPREKPVAALAHLPLDWPGGTTRKSDGHRAVVLRATIRLGRSRCREIRADVARIEFDRVQAAIHVEPGRIGRGRRRVRVCRPVNSTVVS